MALFFLQVDVCAKIALPPGLDRNPMPEWVWESHVPDRIGFRVAMGAAQRSPVGLEKFGRMQRFGRPQRTEALVCNGSGPGRNIGRGIDTESPTVGGELASVCRGCQICGMSQSVRGLSRRSGPNPLGLTQQQPELLEHQEPETPSRPHSFGT